MDIAAQVKAAKETEVRLSAAREVYRSVASNGALLYFLINNLNQLDRVYHYSMANFVAILTKGASTLNSCKRLCLDMHCHPHTCTHTHIHTHAHTRFLKRSLQDLQSQAELHVDVAALKKQIHARASSLCGQDRSSTACSLPASV